MWRRILGGGLIAGVVVAATVSISSWRQDVDARGCSAPPAELTAFVPAEPPRRLATTAFATAAGEARSLEAFHGKGVVLNFWATWCAPCVREMPSLDRLKARVADDGIGVVALSEDQDADKVVGPFLEKLGVRHLEALVDRRQGLLTALGVGALPTTVLVDGGVREVGRVQGAVEWDQPAVQAFLRRCLSPAG